MATMELGKGKGKGKGGIVSPERPSGKGHGKGRGNETTPTAVHPQHPAAPGAETGRSIINDFVGKYVFPQDPKILHADLSPETLAKAYDRIHTSVVT
jgi:hypothetical protein